MLLSLNTGLRRGELFNLHWADVRFDGNPSLTVVGAHAKAVRPVTFRSIAEALKVLKDWREQTGATEGLVFPGKDGKPLGHTNSA
ncbi:MAG: tyrosine-type recombinase/integrase [Candidatus Competibacteraceae bacterium]